MNADLQTAWWSEQFRARPELTHAVFDFDGTLSWIRHGWPGLMARVMLQYFPARPGETEQQILDSLTAELLSLNGKPTIFQMVRFGERVHQRGGTCPSPEALRQEYQDRLDRVIEERAEEIRSGRKRADDFVVHGVRPVLEKLRARGIRLMVLSGTVEHRVRQEAELLELAPFFEPHIHGGKADGAHDAAQFSKRKVLERILHEERISGRQLISFGDGPVEITETKALGGVAIGVASNEDHNGSGIMDPWKRQQLLEAGSDALIADFRNPDQLLKTIFG